MAYLPPPPAPRSFAGQKDTSIADFALAFAYSLGNKDKYVSQATQIAALCIDGLHGGSPGVTDLGGLMKLQHATFLKILEAAGADASWAATWQDILDFVFPTPAPAYRVPDSVECVKPESGLRESKFKSVKRRVGSELLSDGKLDGFVLMLSDFPELECANPSLESLSAIDCSYVVEVAMKKVIALTGIPSLDKIMKKHIGKSRWCLSLEPVSGCSLRTKSSP